jgi:UDP-N-acetylglucosamine:LPS N-acetylglucosamine transferase
VFTTEQNLWKVAELAQADAVLVATSIEKLQDNVVRLIQAPDRRSKMAHAARHLIDGMGAKRLAAAITGLTYSKS